MRFTISNNTKKNGGNASIFYSVRERGLEPPRLTAPVPKTGVFTNYTTHAFQVTLVTGAPTRIRTWDHLLKRELLYQLSYGCDYIFITFFYLIYNGAQSGSRTHIPCETRF